MNCYKMKEYDDTWNKVSKNDTFSYAQAYKNVLSEKSLSYA